jgi:hypothetical protein
VSIAPFDTRVGTTHALQEVVTVTGRNGGHLTHERDLGVATAVIGSVIDEHSKLPAREVAA